MVRVAGIEPAAPWFQARNATVTPHPASGHFCMNNLIGREGFEPSPNRLKVCDADRYTSDPTNSASKRDNERFYLPISKPEETGLEPA